MYEKQMLGEHSSLDEFSYIKKLNLNPSIVDIY